MGKLLLGNFAKKAELPSCKLFAKQDYVIPILLGVSFKKTLKVQNFLSEFFLSLK